MLPTPTLGAAIIVKNAESSIILALDSLYEFVQQIVVVDTGSTDQTPQICSRYGTELHFHKWTDNFSEARNYALERMRTDWIIQLDADEELDRKSLENISQLLNTPSIAGLHSQILNVLDGGIESEHLYTRIFRRHPKIRYEGAIHEQIAGSIREAGFEIMDSPVVIRHFGYAEHSPEKIVRNTTLLRKELADNPDDKWLSYHLGLTEFAAGNRSEAKSTLEPIVNSQELSIEQRETVRLRLAQIALESEKSDIVKKWLDFRSADVHREGLRLFILGAAYAIQKDFHKAIFCFTQEATSNSRLVNQLELQSFIDGISSFLNQS
ncbi:MAG: glycosyltransferase [Ignavibacteriae bacterium]|nr:glycosyltransferase [Ignavibacteriota bacterium]